MRKRPIPWARPAYCQTGVYIAGRGLNPSVIFFPDVTVTESGPEVHFNLSGPVLRWMETASPLSAPVTGERVPDHISSRPNDANEKERNINIYTYSV